MLECSTALWIKNMWKKQTRFKQKTTSNVGIMRDANIWFHKGVK